MTTVADTGEVVDTGLGLLDRERIIAKAGFNRWLVPPALGVSAALWGGWLERVGPRKAGVVAAFCWAGGLVLGAIGI